MIHVKIVFFLMENVFDSVYTLTSNKYLPRWDCLTGTRLASKITASRRCTRAFISEEESILKPLVALSDRPACWHHLVTHRGWMEWVARKWINPRVCWLHDLETKKKRPLMIQKLALTHGSRLARLFWSRCRWEAIEPCTREFLHVLAP